MNNQTHIFPPDEQSEHMTERAAIREYDGGQSRDQAEQEATQEVGPCCCCGGVRFWVSAFGVIVCERCHPPAVPRLVARVIVLPDSQNCTRDISNGS